MLRELRYSMKGVETSGGSTLWFGKNFSASALGVLSVWMKMLRAPRGASVGVLGAAAAAVRSDGLG